MEEIEVIPPTETHSEQRLDQLKQKANATYKRLAEMLKEMEEIFSAFETDSKSFVVLSKEYGTIMQEIYIENIKTKF